MNRAIELAEQAKENGNHPFGALLVVNGEIRLEALNEVITQSDATRHAELSLVSQACKTLSAKERSQATLVTSTEPCAMCCGAIYWSGIRKVVFGCPESQLGRFAGTDFLIPSKKIFSFADSKVEIVGPILEKEAARVHEDFWNT